MASYDDTATVSGSVVSIDNGADEVGAKSCVVNVRPTLSGVSSVTETQIPSRNMASMSDADFTLNSVHYYTENGVLYIDGTSTSETSSNNNAFKVLDFWLPSGTYYFSRGTTLTSLNVPAYLKKYDDKSQIVVNTGSFTLSEKTHLYIGLYVYQKTFADIKAEICINLGSTAITYEDTAPITQYTASLGRTIYGGQVDIVNGTGTEEYGRLVLNSDNMNIISRVNANKYRVFNADCGALVTGSDYADIVVSSPLRPQTGTANDDRAYINANGDIRMNFTAEYNSVADMISAVGSITIVYPIATPTDFTFTGQEIPTRLGYNAFWADSGDTELTYYKSGYGFTSVTVHKETPDGEPVVQTAKFHRIVYGGQADVVKGTCEQDWSDTWTWTSGMTPTYINDHNVYYITKSDVVKIDASNQRTLVAAQCDSLPSKAWASVQSSTEDCCGCVWGQGLAIKIIGLSSKAEYEAYLAEHPLKFIYMLNEPITFSFPPISIGTDEGENTLFANEGDSAITYRKAVD